MGNAIVIGIIILIVVLAKHKMMAKNALIIKLESFKKLQKK